MPNDKRFAVLIDADNVSNKYIKYILDELSNDGVITYKRIYGDWTSNSMISWKSVLLENSITPVQQYSYTTGKNATDSAMIIDAMDILYAGNVEGFCIVSSDSDFTRLAARLREAGKTVVGMGERKTPSPFISACNKFTYLEVLEQEAVENTGISIPAGTGSVAGVVAAGGGAERIPLELVKRTVRGIINEISDEDGWAPLSNIGSILTKRFPDFDVRNYGYKKFSLLITALNLFEIKSVPSRDTSVKQIYIRERPIKGRLV